MGISKIAASQSLGFLMGVITSYGNDVSDITHLHHKQLQRFIEGDIEPQKLYAAGDTIRGKDGQIYKIAAVRSDVYYVAPDNMTLNWMIPHDFAIELISRMNE